MAPGSNWVSSFPPVEMMLWPFTPDQISPPPFPFATLAHDDVASYQYHLLPQPPKLEGFFGGHRSSPLAPCSDAGESSSLSTIHDRHQYHHHNILRAIALPGSSVGSEVEDAASATGNRIGSSDHSPESGAEFALSVCPWTPPPTGSLDVAASEKTKTTTAVAASCQRTSIYRGVTRHRWTGRYEAHLWDNTCRREGQKRKGRQVYLGGYDNEEKAARAYDLAALKYWGLTATTNFPVKIYSKEMEEMQHMGKQEFIASIRRKSSGFSRGASIYRGVTRHHQHGRWQARIGRVAGNKDLYLGTFTTEEEAAEAYDVAAIKFRGANAVTNFELSRYNVEAIANTELPIGASAKRIKQSLQASSSSQPALISSDAPQHPGALPSALHNLLQLYPAAESAGSLRYLGLSETDPDLCGQRLYWLTSNTPHDNQLYDREPAVETDLLHLTHLADSQ